MVREKYAVLASTPLSPLPIERFAMPGGKSPKRFTNAAEASTRWPVSGQACCRRAAVLMVSGRWVRFSDVGVQLD